ncbi:MAG: nuclear transport factor 2 family protein [Bacteroidia bacterium]|nr:nuclear transport factor 2 family protein [Bacteroidia bacterium]
MTYKERAHALYELLNEGKSFEALDKFYADELTVIDNNFPPREGKEVQKQAIQRWFDSVQEFHGRGTHSITSDEEAGVTSVECWVDFTFKNGHRVKMEEVAIQRWQGDKIVHERFYYQMEMPPQQ